MGLRTWWARQQDRIWRPAAPPPDRAPHRQNRAVPPPPPRQQPQRNGVDPTEGRSLQVSAELKALHDNFLAGKRERRPQARRQAGEPQAREQRPHPDQAQHRERDRRSR